ncbi:hypothetical protein ON010_g15813 [Phytophthora cinnamomi]|nr:hypothetical protein ON010_g15813 [Phytophthora cinnamomi]
MTADRHGAEGIASQGGVGRVQASRCAIGATGGSSAQSGMLAARASGPKGAETAVANEWAKKQEDIGGGDRTLDLERVKLTS